MARTLLARGRPDDVVKMIEALARDDVRDDSEVIVHALMARVHLLVHADPDRARLHLDKAFALAEPSPEAESERHLWRGWLHAWPRSGSFEPALALADFQDAHRIANQAYIPSTAAWALLGGSFLYGWLREPTLAQHLLGEAGASNPGRHDVDFRAWYCGCAAASSLVQRDTAGASERLEESRSATESMNVSLYAGRVLALQTRLAVLEGAPADHVERIAAEARPLVADGARTYSPAMAELELCRIDAAIREGDFEEAGALLDGIPDDAAGLVLIEDRLAERRRAIAERQVPLPSSRRTSLPQHPLRWPDGSTFDLAFWRSVPDVANSRLPLLLVGDRGTGKKYFAEQMHQHETGRFVLFDCNAPVSGDIDVVLFGADGGGLIDNAAGGTLFLREIHRLPLDTQRRLARSLRTYPDRFRLVASTTHSIPALIASPNFSQELLREIAKLVIHLPPLRHRRSHIPLLIADLIEKLRPRNLTLASITHPALRAMIRYDWPGNIRQLQNEIERMLTVVESEPAPVIHLHDLPEEILQALEPEPTENAEETGALSLEAVVTNAERSHIEQALSRHGGHVSATANALGLTRQGLYKKMKRLGVDPSRLSFDVPESVSA